MKRMQIRERSQAKFVPLSEIMVWGSSCDTWCFAKEIWQSVNQMVAPLCLIWWSSQWLLTGIAAEVALGGVDQSCPIPIAWKAKDFVRCEDWYSVYLKLGWISDTLSIFSCNPWCHRTSWANNTLYWWPYGQESGPLNDSHSGHNGFPASLS